MVERPQPPTHSGLSQGPEAWGHLRAKLPATTTPCRPGRGGPPSTQMQAEATKTPLWVHRAPTSFLPYCAPLGTRTERQEAGTGSVQTPTLTRFPCNASLQAWSSDQGLTLDARGRGRRTAHTLQTSC